MRFRWICLSWEYKPEGFSMFGRRIVSDCGQNSPPGFNTKVKVECVLETFNTQIVLFGSGGKTSDFGRMWLSKLSCGDKLSNCQKLS